jgi:CTP:molybdopterin cytidylyltransferase MocA
MGQAKALLDIDGRPAWQHIVETALAAGCQRALVLCSTQLRKQLPEGSQRVDFSPVPEELRARGPIGSLVHGLSLLEAQDDGAVIWPVDHPFVREETVAGLLQGPGRMRQPELDGRGGHPLWLARSILQRLPSFFPSGTLRDLLGELPLRERSRRPSSDFGVRWNSNEPEQFEEGLRRWREASKSPD